MRTRTGAGRGIAMWLVVVMTSAFWIGGGLVASADPPGNNGTVKVAGVSVDAGNDSHVGCAFTVEFSGYDDGDLFADLTLEGRAPTEDGTLFAGRVFIGEDPAGGANDLDASAPLDLSGAFAGSPQPNQGFHVALTVHADGSQGADVKHKTLWVQCVSDGEGGGEG